MIAKRNLRDLFLIMYTIQIISISYMAIESPFVANNITSLILINSLICFASSFYLLDWKTLRSWYIKKKYEAIHRIKFKENIRQKAALEVGLGYGEFKGK